LRQLTLNEPALAEGASEGVHQMRVATRRLRAAISLFGVLFDDRESALVKTRLRWLTEQLGPLRDYDVLIKQATRRANDSGLHEAAFEKLATSLRQRRSQKLAQAQSAVASERYRELVLDTARWILGGEWTSAPERRRQRQRRRRLAPLSRKLLQRRTRRVQKRLETLAELPPEQRHRLRIAIKKLHYGVQFFDSFLTGRNSQQKQLTRVLARLQDQLGKINDARVHQDLARELLDTPMCERGSDCEEAFALGLLRGQEDARLASLVRGATQQGRKLGRLQLRRHGK
jgi:CHAD domain-containing protein